MHIDRVDQLAKAVRNSDAPITAVGVVDFSTDEMLELCALARAHVMSEAAEAAFPTEPEPVTDWSTLHSAFQEASRGLTKITEKTARARAVAALAILLDVDPEVAEILSEH